METEYTNEYERRQYVEDVLESDDLPTAKVQELIHLGIDDETAESLVARRQEGASAALYYEQLDEHF